ncbi:hypothetical protein Tco_1458893 [Tanacetum coccineum]
MGQMAEDLQESPLGVLPSNTVTDPLVELNMITSMDGLTLDGSFTPHYNFLVYQEEKQEPKTITKVVEISSSKSTPLVPPPETPPLNNNSMSGNSHSFIDSSGRDSLPISLFPSDDTLILKIRVETSTYLLILIIHDPRIYEAFSICGDDDHIEKKSSGSTTTHFDSSLPEYDSFIFDLLIDPLPPADRSDLHHEEFADRLAHIISPLEYDRFYFDLEIIPGDFTRVLEENIFDLSSKCLTINELNDSSLLLSDYDSSLSKEFTKIDLLVSFPSGNEDMIFDLGIFIIKRVQSKRFQFFPQDDFPTFSFISDSLLLINPSNTETFL